MPNRENARAKENCSVILMRGRVVQAIGTATERPLIVTKCANVDPLVFNDLALHTF